MAAEIADDVLAGGRLPRFNEAAANGRGNCPDDPVIADVRERFNEAAANGRGNAGRLAARGAHGTASMRPRRMAAEINEIVGRDAGYLMLQ